MITANFIGSEQSCGYTKNFAGQLSDKGYMAISKFVVTSFAQTVILVIYSVVLSALAQLLFGEYINGYDIGALFAALGLRLMLHLAINAIIIFICTLTKSHAVAMVAGCIFGIGVTKIAYSASEMIFSIMKINFPIGSYMPDGVNSQLAMDTVGELYIKALVVSILFIAVFLATNFYVLRKRDVK
jgi:ABC-type transport system involved in multi-copper enzyme maturation permease subunit